MKQLLILLFLTLGTSAFANTQRQTPPPVTENHEPATVTTKKAATAKAAKIQEDTTKAVKDAQLKEAKKGSVKTCSTVENSHFGVSAYFVELVHTGNVKLVKLLL